MNKHKFMAIVAKLTKSFLASRDDAQLLAIREEILSEAFSQWAIANAQSIMQFMNDYGPHVVQRDLNDKDIAILINVMMKYVGANVFLPSYFRATATNDPSTIRQRAYAALDTFSAEPEENKNVH